MEQKDENAIRAALAQPFAPEDLEWRLQRTVEETMRGSAVSYVTNRAIQHRLDEVVGPSNWYNDYRPWHSSGKKESQLCGISIYFEGRGFITKWDGAEDSDIEPIKGGLSDSMKRAAVQWGIGRILYEMEPVWVDIEKRGKSFIIADSSRPKLERAYMKMLERLKLTPTVPAGTQALFTPKTSALASVVPLRGTETAVQPEYEYTVEEAHIQKGVSTQSTVVMLRAKDGKTVKAFARGAREELTEGVLLAEVQMHVQRQNTVVFQVLDEYKVVGADTRAV
ncbi:MAG: hypothetical protein LUC36_01995 [Oscillospiraceae bacterium]|nr:hypothetical protein [Oscillospiraceae bacterium]